MAVKSVPEPGEPIAVIGSGCRCPGGANTPSKLWELLKSPTDLRKKIPKQRFNADTFYHPDSSRPGATNVQHCYHLEEDIHKFDSAFFGIQPHEAAAIDPQQRLLLETVYEALSSAGLKIEHLQGSSTAVYVGVMMHDFADLVNLDPNHIPTYAATGTSGSILSNRVSYFFDWHGPSVAVHQAVQQLRNGGSKVAIAAGANLILSPFPFIVESKMNMLSPTGRSRMWDAKADGYARGEGVASIVLKTLKQAIEDGDSIECIIRETGVNSDGRSPGITMPNSRAQEALIRDTYTRAGLDLLRERDRCQYFEAHGTGTPAGDPREAEAISRAFFGPEIRGSEEIPLYVGSIKTIIGHTEGTAGIAGLMKASLALQQGILPPNLHFDHLSPTVAPFYKDLSIVTTAIPWPAIPEGGKRRASVNSFGFGGTNAHAILEQYIGTSGEIPSDEANMTLVPMVVSAKTKAALKATLVSLLQSLKAETYHIQDVSWTLMMERSVLPIRRAITGTTLLAVSEALERDLLAMNAGEDVATTSELHRKPSILGIFTGQGAQWPGMGRRLILSLRHARYYIEDLQCSLDSLPLQYRPSWNLVDELLLEGDASHVNDAQYSQPLVCAVQLLLLELLHLSGVSFSSVVGHSSGEIAAAFAAGLISASQAIRIAYLRGLMSQLASSPDKSTGSAGSMLAVGTSYEDAKALCDLEMFHGRICVAAINSAESVTISGDKESIQQAKLVFGDEGKFNRILKVDKAYHSHHMKVCSAAYYEALRLSGCDVAEPDARRHATFISTVYRQKMISAQDIDAQYWVNNLVSPVLFSYAVESAVLSYVPVDLVVEVGCHPALKSPCLSIINDCLSVELPYSGCMKRNGNDLESFSDVLGYIWERFGSDCFDTSTIYSKLLHNPAPRSLSKTLPTYPWDYSRSHLNESRITNAFLRHGSNLSPLLGKQSTSSTRLSVEWTNTIRVNDLKWLEGHMLQGQFVFPAAGYVVMVLDAARQIVVDNDVKLFEVLDLKLEKAITFEDENTPVDIHLNLDVLSEEMASGYVSLSFKLFGCLAKESNLSLCAHGQIILTLGSPDAGMAPRAHMEPPHMADVNIENFYSDIRTQGYEYSGEFRSLRTMKRGNGASCGILGLSVADSSCGSLMLHPASLDVAFQTLIGAFAAPGDNRLRSLLVPKHISRVVFSPGAYKPPCEDPAAAQFRSFTSASKNSVLSGDIELSDSTQGNVFLQVEDISFVSLSPLSPSDDHCMFSRWVNGKLELDPIMNNPKYAPTMLDEEEAAFMERLVFFYVRSLPEFDSEALASLAPHYAKQIHHLRSSVRAGSDQNTWYNASWETDSLVMIEDLLKKYEKNPQVRLIHRVGTYISEIIGEDLNIFEIMNYDGLLSEFYASSPVFQHSYHYMGDMVSHIAHRYPNMDVIEIGGGTGGATKKMFELEQISFGSYTFTDLSASFFEQARDEFEDREDILTFQPLDIRVDPTGQGFKKHSYDMVLASNVLHATPSLKDTLINVRALLKPGGYLVVIEATQLGNLRYSFLFGFFADWWAGENDGRSPEPFLPLEDWDRLLKETSFSGIECSTADLDGRVFPNAVFCARAVDDTTLRLIKPLSAPLQTDYPEIVVVGGLSLEAKQMLNSLQSCLSHRPFVFLDSLGDVTKDFRGQKSTFLVASELDKELFSALNEQDFEALKLILRHAKSIVWLTQNAWLENPYQAMSIGLLRSLRLEHIDVNIQVIDVDSFKHLDSTCIAEQLLRVELGSAYHHEDILWTNEPEIYITRGSAWIQRLRPDYARNNRLNATRRNMLTPTNSRQYPVKIHNSKSEVYFEQSYAESSRLRLTQPGFLVIHVRYALAAAIRVGDLGYFYLLQGVIADSNEAAVALSEVNSSIVRVPAHSVFSIMSDTLSSQCMLLPITAELVADTMQKETSFHNSVVVFEPPEFCVEAITRQLTTAGTTVTFASTRESSASCRACWQRLHENETRRVLVEFFKEESTALYGFSVEDKPTSLGHRLASCATQNCQVRGPEHFFRERAMSRRADSESLTEILSHALNAVKAWHPETSSAVISPQELSEARHRNDLSTVIDWQLSSQNMSARVSPIDDGEIFNQDKCYLLVGLTGDLGRSLCLWMIRHGARHVVLSSRSPNIDERWLAEARKLGAHILVLPMDVADEQSVAKGLAEIHESMPPIGGVAFGPLVLRDTLFKDMELDQMRDVLRPKVTGLRLLDQHTAEITPPLDFFVAFSSVVLVAGNAGQSAYGAANAFTHSLIQQRRARGLAGSTINIGPVYGVGFLAGREDQYHSIKHTFDPVSEQELHSLFAEAVFSSAPDCDDGVEISTGIRFMQPSHRETIPYFDDPRFRSFRLVDKDHKVSGGEKAAASVKMQLLEAESLAEVRQIITDGLRKKLLDSFQIDIEGSDALSIPLIDQGVDSLSAIGIGKWVSHNLNLELPLLKILSGISVTGIVDDVLGRLSPSATPRVLSREPRAAIRPNNQSNIKKAPHAEINKPGPVASDNSPSLLPAAHSPAVETGTTVTDDSSSQRQGPMSMNQQYIWRLPETVSDPTAFNITIGMHMRGAMDGKRLQRAVERAFQRHEIFRTRFLESDPDHDNKYMQVVMKSSRNRFNAVTVSDQAEAEQNYEELKAYKYDLAVGDCLQIVVFSWSPTNHLLVFGVHEMVCDAWSFEKLFVEIGALYDGAQLPIPTQYLDFTARQREEYKSGQMSSDLEYWNTIYKSIGPRANPKQALPRNGFPSTWKHHTLASRLPSALSVKVKQLSRKLLATPMQFYLATFYILLLRSDQHTAPVAIGIADIGRSSLEDLSTMGRFLNLIAVNINQSGHVPFSEIVARVKGQLGDALDHAKTPALAILDTLADSEACDQSQWLRAVFDYKQGQTESGRIGDAEMTEVLWGLPRTPYAITLQISDDYTRDPLVTFRLQDGIYQNDDLQSVMHDYLSLLTLFADNTEQWIDVELPVTARAGVNGVFNPDSRNGEKGTRSGHGICI